MHRPDKEIDPLTHNKKSGVIAHQTLLSDELLYQPGNDANALPADAFIVAAVDCVKFLQQVRINQHRDCLPPVAVFFFLFHGQKITLGRSVLSIEKIKKKRRKIKEKVLTVFESANIISIVG